jgi:hypothetical protein
VLSISGTSSISHNAALNFEQHRKPVAAYGIAVSFLLSALLIASVSSSGSSSPSIFGTSSQDTSTVRLLKLLQGSNKSRKRSVCRLCWIFVEERGREASR